MLTGPARCNEIGPSAIRAWESGMANSNSDSSPNEEQDRGAPMPYTTSRNDADQRATLTGL